MQKTENFYQLEKGGSVHSFSVLEGVTLSFYDLKVPSWQEEELPGEGRIVEINHCELGCYECVYPEGNTVFFPEGHFSFSSMTERKLSDAFPEQIYSGVTILIDLDQGEKEFFPLLRSFELQPESLVKAWEEALPCRIIRENGRLRELFRELYETEDQLTVGKLRLRLVELFLILDDFLKEEKKHTQRPTGNAKLDEIRELLESSLDKELSLEDLAETKGLSASWVRKSFRKVYGKSPGQYRKEIRMRYAARCLAETEESIAGIGMRVGYSNPSKFSAAFQSVMNHTPSAYRKLITFYQ